MMPGLPKNDNLDNGHDVIMETDLGRGLDVAFGRYSFFTVRERCSKLVVK